jgi:outer membrane protein
MKKVILSLMAAALLAAPGLAAPAQAADIKIGIVDTQSILGESSLLDVLRKAEQEVAAAEKKLVDARNQKIKELEQAQKTMKVDDFIKLRQRYEREIVEQVKAEETKIEQKRQDIQKRKIELENKVESVVQAIAKKKGLDLVINKQLVLFGGIDITNEVIAEIKKK